MPLLRKQHFVRNPAPPSLKPEDEVFYCEVTKEVFTNYDDFFQRTILCNSLVWSCSITGKSNLTFEEALESEEKARKRVGNLPKPLKRGILWLAAHTKRGRLTEVADDVYEFSKQRYFKGEIIEAVINDQWCDAKITKVIPPTQAEISQAEQEGEEEDEITEVDADGCPKNKKPTPAKTAVHEDLFKYEVEEVEPDDEDMVMLHIIPAEDVKREKGVFTRDKLNLYMKNVVELEGMHFKVKEKVAKMYDLDKVRFEDVFAGPPPKFAETQNKKAVLNKNKKGQFTLDGWIKEEKVALAKEGPKPAVIKQKKQTPEELELEMKRMREAQAKYKEDMKLKLEEEKRKRAEERAREMKRKKEEQKLIKELIQEWSRRREDLECEDLKELPRPAPVHCHIPNQFFGDFVALLEFLNSFSQILALKDTYPGGLTFHELETAITEKEVPDGAFFELLSYMLITVFDLQSEEIEEAKADSDKSVLDQADRNVLGKDLEIAQAIKAATETANFTKKNLGLALRDCHMDIWSLTEILRLHLESSGAFRGHNLQNWRFQQRGGFRLSDDPGFQFCREEPQILLSLQQNIVTELSVPEKLKILNCLMLQMLTYAGVRDEIDTRLENMVEAGKDLREAVAQENKRIREQAAEDKKEKREEMIKKKEETLKDAVVKTSEEKKEVKTERQKEALKLEEEKKEKEKNRKEELKRAEFFQREKDLQAAMLQYQNQVYIQCLGRDRAYRRFWMFDSLPGIFVEHEDDYIGDCQETPTPWNPNAGPLTEEQATEKARELLAQQSEEMDEVSTIKLTEVNKTYSKKPVLKQQVLTANGGLEVETKKEGSTAEEQGKDSRTEDGPEQDAGSPPWGRCEGNRDNCPVHSTILPRTHWAFYHTVEELNQLIDSLNPRGVREGELRDRLVLERESMELKLKKSSNTRASSWLSKTKEDLEREEEKTMEALKKKREKNAKYGGALAMPVGTSMKNIVEISLRDQIRELEEKINNGSLGTLKVDDREKWHNAVACRGYSMCCDELVWGGGEEGMKLTPEMLEGESRANTPDSNKRSSTGSNTEAMNLVVKQLAAAILQVGQMINDEEKYLKSPLGEDDKDRKRRLKEQEKKKKERDVEEEDGIICEEKQSVLTPRQRWEISLMSCTHMGQLFLHLTTLENSVVWSKSIMNTKCRICRRKTDPDKMLLCDGCDRGHHIYCLKPKLKAVPSGDWFCSDCKPKERVRSPKKKVRRVFSSTEESEGEDEVEEVEETTEVEQSFMEDDENDEDYGAVKKKKSKAKKKILQEPEPEPAKKKAKKGGIANLLGKRKIVEEEDEIEEEEEEEERKSKRGKGGKGAKNSKEENKENTRKRRRGDLDDDIELLFNVTGLQDLINGMLSHKDGWPFDRPITKADAPDYHKIIKNPMDLGTIKSRLHGLKYSCNQEVLDDVRLMFRNCLQYNMEDTEEYQCALRLDKYFNREISKMGLTEEPVKSKRNRRTL